MVELEPGDRTIEEPQIFELSEAENPPLAPGCKPKWKIDKKKKCTNKYIQQHLVRKFNTEFAAETGVKRFVKILMTFVIDPNGKVINKSASGGSEVINQHAIEVIELLPDFISATKEGQPVNVRVEIHLLFHIAG